eukprot:4705090-Pleurochrysis_carterae.AAC.1
MACFRVLGDSAAGVVAKAQPVDLLLQAPSCRWKCCGARAASKSSCREAQSSSAEVAMGSSACACVVAAETPRDAVGSFAASPSETGAMGSSARASMASTRGVGPCGVDVSVPCAEGNRERTARESSRLRLGGYAALSRDVQLPHRFWPPTCVE